MKKGGEPVGLPQRSTYSSRKSPFRSLPVSANTPRELASLIVKVTPFSRTVKFAVAVALRNAPAKSDGSMGLVDPGWEFRFFPNGFRVPAEVPFAYSVRVTS